MAPWGILTLICVAFIFVEARRFHQKRETKSHICDPSYNNTNKIQCFCNRASRYDDIKSADCYLAVDGVAREDINWNVFKQLKAVGKIEFSKLRGFSLKYIPKNALQHTTAVLKLSIKYANIEVIEPFAFANLTLVREIILTDNQIKTLKPNAFSHHRDLATIGLDTNTIVEINRDVFIELPSLEKVYLTNNKITTIHDRAFVHLTNLRELEIDRNNLFSLNSETFSGLKKLEKLDLSGNSLEVIGDNTFLPLKNLRSLNLEENKIQMLDEKAFRGLSKLNSLSLAHNMIKDIENVKIFEGLKSLFLVSLKGNQLNNLKPELIEPILNNLYHNISSLDVEDNNFPCDCRLDWFLTLFNKTESPLLKLTIENLKCLPSTDLREKWTKATETEKIEEPEEGEPAADYEYYDESQLNGKLFYMDLRFLLNCSDKFDETTPNVVTTPKLTKPTTKVMITESTTPKINNILEREFSTTEFNNIQEITENEKKVFTTTRLATVSEKPIENNNYDHEMASDEAKPDKIKAHRSVQEMEDVITNNANGNVGCVMLSIPFILYLLIIYI